MVIGTPDVEEVIEPSAELVEEVADVGGEIRWLAGRADQRTVLVVPERRRPEPDSAILLVHVAVLAKALDRTVNPAFAMQPALAGPHVEAHAELGERLLDPAPNPLGRPAPDHVGCVTRLRLGLDVRRQFASKVVHVVAVVPVVRDGFAVPDREHARPEVAHLHPEIVEVVLARDGLPTGLEQPAEQIADERPTRVADMQRPGGVGRHELDVDSARAHRRDRAPRLGRGEHRIEQPLERPIGEPQVDEARRRHVDGGEGRGGGIGLDLAIELFLERRGDRERRHAARSGELHGQVAGQVAVCRIGRSLDFDRGSVLPQSRVRQRTRGHGAVAGAFEGGTSLRPEGRRRGDRGSGCFGQRGLLKKDPPNRSGL